MANFENAGLKGASRTGETNVKHALCIPITAPYGSRRLNSRQLANEGGDVSTGHQSPFLPGNICGTHFWPGLIRSEGHIGEDRIM